jgi:hypothetical protein
VANYFLGAAHNYFFPRRAVHCEAPAAYLPLDCGESSLYLLRAVVGCFSDQDLPYVPESAHADLK